MLRVVGVDEEGGLIVEEDEKRMRPSDRVVPPSTTSVKTADGGEKISTKDDRAPMRPEASWDASAVVLIRRAERFKEEGNQAFREGRAGLDIATKRYKAAVEMLTSIMTEDGWKMCEEKETLIPRRAKMLVDLFSNLATVHFKCERFDVAEKCASACIAIDPDHVKARFRRGILFQRRGLHDRAVEDFQRALEHGKDASLSKIGRALDKSKKKLRKEKKRADARLRKVFAKQNLGTSGESTSDVSPRARSGQLQGANVRKFFAMPGIPCSLESTKVHSSSTPQQRDQYKVVASRAIPIGAVVMACDALAWIPSSADGDDAEMTLGDCRKATSQSAVTTFAVGDETLRLTHATIRAMQQRATEPDVASAHARIPPKPNATDVDLLLTHADDIRRAQTGGRRALAELRASVCRFRQKATTTVQDPSIDAFVELALRVKFNCHAIQDPMTGKRTGLGLFPFAAFLNHSCRPNVIISHYASGDARTIVFRALRPIRKGEEIAYAYIDVLQTRKQRQKLLREAYFFECACPRCSEPIEASETVDRLMIAASPDSTGESNDISLESAEGLVREELSAAMQDMGRAQPLAASRRLTALMTDPRRRAFWAKLHPVHHLKLDALVTLSAASRHVRDFAAQASSALRVCRIMETIDACGTPRLADSYCMYGMAVLLLIKETDASCDWKKMHPEGKSGLRKQALSAIGAACKISDVCYGNMHPKAVQLHRILSKAKRDGLS
eukprot:g1300.t1